MPKQSQQPPIFLAPETNLKQWVFFPDSLPGGLFRGFEDRDDPTALRGAFVVGQNVKVGQDSLPVVRDGYEPVGFQGRVEDRSSNWVTPTAYQSLTSAPAVYRAGQTVSPSVDVRAVSVDFRLKKAGSPTGDAYAKIWECGPSGLPDDAALPIATSRPFDVSTLGTGYSEVNFYFPGDQQVVLRAGSTYVVAVETGTSVPPNYVDVGYVASSPSGSMAVFGTTWDLFEPNGCVYRLNGKVRESTDSTPVTRAWTFETRDGTILELKSYGDRVDYRIQGAQDDWWLLRGGFTPGLEFCYANIGMSGGGFYSHFCNGVDGWFAFSGAFAAVASSTATTITKASGTWTDDGFTATGSVVIDGTEYAYTGGAGTDTLTGVTPDPTTPAWSNAVAVQAAYAVSSMASYQGSVGTAHDGRIHARLESEQSVWDYSKLDDPQDWTPGSNDGDGGSKDVEFGGPIVAFGKLNQSILAGKRTIVKSLTFQQSGNRVDVPTYDTFVTADDKSTTIGMTNQRSTFSSPKGLIFTTPDKRMVLLTGITRNAQPDPVILSDRIQPVFDRGIHDGAAGICVDNVDWYAFRSTPSATYNDTVLRGDMSRNSVDSQGNVLPIRWDTPYVGWNANDWTALYDPESGTTRVHWHSSVNSTSYAVTSQKSDGQSPYSCAVRTWAETFGEPTRQKIVDRAWVEIRMTPNTNVTMAVLYDEDGVTGQEEHALSGDDSGHEFAVTTYNPFGLNPFGTQKFGSEPESTALPLYRFEVELRANVRFFNVSMQFSCDDAGQDFQVVRFGYRLKQVVQDTEYRYLTP